MFSLVMQDPAGYGVFRALIRDFNGTECPSWFCRKHTAALIERDARTSAQSQLSRLVSPKGISDAIIKKGEAAQI